MLAASDVSCSATFKEEMIGQCLKHFFGRFKCMLLCPPAIQSNHSFYDIHDQEESYAQLESSVPAAGVWFSQEEVEHQDERHLVQ